ncbi:hypothetical protein DTO002I6_9944 [Penicillium roqueforti]|nr:hypothetical protein DTO002I6_9944 [Penicillium roqueforti]
MDALNSAPHQEKGDQQPSALPILGEKDESQESSDYVPLASETTRLQTLLLTIAALPFAAGSRNKTHPGDRAISTYLEGSSRPRARRSKVRLSSSSTSWTLSTPMGVMRVQAHRWPEARAGQPCFEGKLVHTWERRGTVFRFVMTSSYSGCFSFFSVMADKNSLRCSRRAQDAAGTMPLLDHRPITRLSRKSKAANNSVQPALKRAQDMLLRRLQQRCLRPETWWEPITGLGPHCGVLEQKMQHEKCIAQEEVQQE